MSLEEYIALKLKDRILLPNGVESAVNGIDELDDTIMDHCGSWHSFEDCEVIKS